MTEAAILANQAALLAELAEIRSTLDEVLRALPVPDTLTVSDIACRRGTSRAWLCLESAPWRLPGFGKPDQGDRVRRWRRDTVVDWYASPTWEAERREEWEKLSPAERRKVREVEG